MLRRSALLTMVGVCVVAQSVTPPSWKEFSIGPARPKQGNGATNIRHGELHTGSISLKSLLGIAANVPTVRILGPDWLDSEYYSIDATLSDETRLQLRTRSKDDPVAVEFRTLLNGELAHRFRLEYHRETRESRSYTLQPAEGRVLKARPSTSLERGRLSINHSSLSGNTTFDARNVTYRTISNWLQGRLHLPVTLAETLPEGTYYFHFQWKTKDDHSLTVALQDQLGLALVEAPASQEYVIVDRAEMPDFPVTGTAPAGTKDLVSTFTPAQIREDLRVLRESLEEGHPGIYRFTPKGDLDRAFDRTAAQFSRPMDATEIYRVLAPVVALLKCGHTSLRPSADLQERVANAPLIPIEAAVLGGKVYVQHDFSSSQLEGAEILTINGVAIDRILAAMLAVVHGDGDSTTAGPYQLSHGRGFARNLYLVAGLQSPFRVRYSIHGKTAEASLNGMPLKLMSQADARREPSTRRGNATWRVLDGGTTGVLRITSFGGKAEDDSPLGAFFHQVFAEAHEKNRSRLILDLRDNGGGEDQLGRELFGYFADRPFQYYRDLIVNKLEFSFFRYVPNREPLPPNVHELVTSGADGRYHFTGHPNWGTLQPSTPHFGGKVVVLMNGGSFSTTCEFLATLHNHGGATFAGEETAGGYYGNTSGADVSVLLPNSKLILPVQLVGYYMAIEGNAHGTRGIQPDEPVEYSIEDVLGGRDRAMEVALRLAAQAP